MQIRIVFILKADVVKLTDIICALARVAAIILTVVGLL
jgi:hypothetical protein